MGLLALETHPVSCVKGARALSLGVKQLGHETDYSPPSYAEVKNAWSYTSTPQYIFMVYSFTFY
jgi:hypothetical protein